MKTPQRVVWSEGMFMSPQHLQQQDAYALVTLTTAPEGSQRLLPTLEATLRPTPPQVQTIIAGGPVFYADIEKTSSDDLKRGEIIAFPLALIALALVFGSLVAAATPIAPAPMNRT